MSVARLVLVSLLAVLPGSAGVLTFEGLGDLQSVDNFYSGVTFTNAVAVVAGFSLNDAEFPPVSGVTVATSSGDPVAIDFASPITDFQAAFTHSDVLTLQFLLSGNPVGSVTSVFTNNLAISGDAGTSPNEILSFHSDQTFTAVQFSGGGAFVFDDVTFGNNAGAPEPATVFLTIGAVLVILGSARRRRA